MPCRNVEILTLWHGLWARDNRESPEIYDFMTSPELSPRRISLVGSMSWNDAVHFSYPIFRNATHVELRWSAIRNDPLGCRWDTLRDLPCLTHLSVNCLFLMSGCGRRVQEFVNVFPISLRVFVFWVYLPQCFSSTSPEFEGLKVIQDGNIDSRIVLAFEDVSPPTINLDLDPIFRSYEDRLRDCAGIPVGRDFWALAEEFIEERHRRREK
jgi:hypothetical protein